MSSHWNKDAAFIDLELKPNTIIAAKPSDLVTWAFMKRQKGPYIILSITSSYLKDFDHQLTDCKLGRNADQVSQFRDRVQDKSSAS